MRTPNEQLADALADLRDAQEKIGSVFRGAEIDDDHLGTLLENGYVKRIIKGWYHSSSPGVADGDTTPWAMNCWKFISRYCNERFGEDWVLSPEASLFHHAETRQMQPQVIVHSPKGSNNYQPLPHGHSFLDLKKAVPPSDQVAKTSDGLNVYTKDALLLNIAENCFKAYPAEMSAVLATFERTGSILNLMLAESKPVVMGRIVGAFKHLGMDDQAKSIEDAARRFRINLRVSNPFEVTAPVIAVGKSPIVNRLTAFWQEMAPVVDEVIPPPDRKLDSDAIMKQVDDTYKLDAWHSLSIEGYRVTEEMIQKIRSGDWNPEDDPEDKRSKDALAAKGYYDTFREVREMIVDGVTTGVSKDVVERLIGWYQTLFMPSVNAGILKPHQLSGYRNHPVYIQTAKHVPPRAEVLLDAMDTLGALINDEENPAIRAVLGHWMLGYIHPFPDGNGRLARFVMNSQLVTGGYNWTVIRLEDRSEYMRTLDQASFDGNIRPFAEFIRKAMRFEKKDPDDTPEP